MAVSQNATRELDIGKIVLRSLQLAGLRSPQQGNTGPQWAAQSAMARDFLEMEIDSLQAEGAFARSVPFLSHPVAKDVASFTDLPVDTLDLVGDGMFLPTGQTTGETPVVQIDREAYQRLTDKVATGRPTRYYLSRQAVLEVFLWPVPEVDGNIRFQQHRLLADNNDGSKTIDLQRYWTEYICWALAHKLAVSSSLPIQRCGYLRAESERKLKKAKSFAHQHPDSQMYITHNTGWRRRG